MKENLQCAPSAEVAASSNGGMGSKRLGLSPENRQEHMQSEPSVKASEFRFQTFDW